MKRCKYKGVTIAATAVAIVTWMFLGYIAFIVMASPFSVLASVRTARQAEQYAEFVASSLRLVSYEELDTAAHGRRSLAGEIAEADDWESAVTLSDERRFGEDAENVQRIATVDIFRTGDTLSRYTLQVPLSSASGGSDGIPVGTIIMRTSDFLKTSEGSKYLLCDGSAVPSIYPKLRSLMTRTPDLRDRVPQGSGSYTLGKKIEAALPNIKGGNILNWYASATMAGPFYVYSTTLDFVTNAGSGTKYYQHNVYFDASRCSSIYKNNCTTVQPPALAVNFYIKAK